MKKWLRIDGYRNLSVHLLFLTSEQGLWRKLQPLPAINEQTNGGVHPGQVVGTLKMSVRVRVYACASIISCKFSVLHHVETSWNVLPVWNIDQCISCCHHEREQQDKPFSQESLCIKASTQWLKIQIKRERTVRSTDPLISRLIQSQDYLRARCNSHCGDILLCHINVLFRYFINSKLIAQTTSHRHSECVCACVWKYAWKPANKCLYGHTIQHPLSWPCPASRRGKTAK